MKMVMEFPRDAADILDEITYSGSVMLDLETKSIRFIHSDAVIKFIVHTPDGDFTYTIDNVNKTLTTESETPFLV